MSIIRVLFIGSVIWMSGNRNCFAKDDAVQTEEVKYQADGIEYVGYIAKPKNITGKLPGVLVVHEWWGQTDYPRKRAEMLAQLGYIAMAVDMYGGRKIADHPKDAGAFSQAVMSDAKVAKGRFDAALKTLRAVKEVASDKIAAIGYCFGGSVVLDMAKQGANLRGVVSFHGGLQTPTESKKGQISARMLVLTGAEDKMIGSDQVKTFSKQIKDAGGIIEVVTYPHAQHGFTNPEATAIGKKLGMPISYNEEADKASWDKMKTFLQSVTS
jgi:dienelactone hydrolase